MMTRLRKHDGTTDTAVQLRLNSVIIMLNFSSLFSFIILHDRFSEILFKFVANMFMDWSAVIVSFQTECMKKKLIHFNLFPTAESWYPGILDTEIFWVKDRFCRDLSGIWKKFQVFLTY